MTGRLTGRDGGHWLRLTLWLSSEYQDFPQLIIFSFCFDLKNVFLINKSTRYWKSSNDDISFVYKLFNKWKHIQSIFGFLLIDAHLLFPVLLVKRPYQFLRWKNIPVTRKEGKKKHTLSDQAVNPIRTQMASNTDDIYVVFCEASSIIITFTLQSQYWWQSVRCQRRRTSRWRHLYHCQSYRPRLRLRWPQHGRPQLLDLLRLHQTSRT